ncbi:MAG: hypothetical protein K0R05_108 [Anaerocolumna sp.]|jgi:hypothetical protein|nr:hypothetical protein [Anaerocolumna sp.]
MSDKNKFCFIICSNNKAFEKEALQYIERLDVPVGYTVEVLTVIDALSMTSGYNEAMLSSTAKYKIYLHQDVFIVNTNFLYDILLLFQNSSIGMVGMVGALMLPSHGVMWYGARVGKIYANRILGSMIWSAGEFTESMKEVEAIDGLLMATQYDLPWREDLFKGWDFYDISQSMEFRRKGYKIIIPNQVTPWCIHDEGMNSLEHYYHYRRIFIKEYQDMLEER